MSPRKQVVFLNWEAKTISALLELDVDVLLVIDHKSLPWAEKSPECFAKMRRVYSVQSLDSLEQIAAVAVDIRIRGDLIDQVLSYTELNQYAAGLLSTLLFSENRYLEQSCAVRDKRLMKYKTKKAGINVADFASLPNAQNPTDRSEVLGHLKFPMVIKPANGFGTLNTVRLQTVKAFNDFLDHIRFEGRLASHHLIAEEFIAGEEFHVDAIWHGGEPLLFLVSQYFKPRLSLMTESGGLNGSCIMPKAQNLELYEKVLDLHKCVNRSMNIRDGVTHLEFFKEATGDLIFSEVATRMGGGAITEVVKAYYGEDLRKLWLRAILEMPFPRAKLPSYPVMGFLNVSPTQSGQVTSVPDLAELIKLEGVVDAEINVAIGDLIDVTHPSIWAVLLTIGAESVESLRARANALSNIVRVEVKAHV